MGTGDASWLQSFRGAKLTAHLRLLMWVRTEYGYLPVFIYGLFKGSASSSDHVASHYVVGCEVWNGNKVERSKLQPETSSCHFQFLGVTEEHDDKTQAVSAWNLPNIQQY